MADGSRADRAIVLGLDGVPWPELREWTDAGELENFARLREEGAAGPLESTTPATTPVAWPTIARGVWPDDHGSYWFQQLTEDHSHEMTTSADVSRPALWDLVSPSVVANVPMTYPARPIDGEMVTGMMTPALNEGFTHPPELREEIAERIPDYEIGLTWSEYTDDQAGFLDALGDLVETRRELMDLLLEREDWRLFFFVYTAPDRLQHLVWDEDVLLDHYRTLDDVLGDAMAHASERNANLFVVSDHGFGPIRKHVAVNRVLERAGFLTAREGGTRGFLSEVGVTKDDVLGALETVGLDEERLVRWLPRSLVDRVAGQIPGSHVLYDVDFGETQAFVHGPGAVYVNDAERFDSGVVAPGDRDEVKRAVARTFDELTDPETGDSVLSVHDGEELFPADEDSPDLVLEAADGYEKAVALRDDVFSPVTEQAGGHRSEGVFLAWGPDVEAGTAPTEASVVDVAPTVLHSIDESVPAHSDGTVLEELLAEQAAVTEQVVGEASAGGVDAERDEDFEDVTERLRGLGYMD